MINAETPPKVVICYLWKDVEISNIEEGRALFVADRAKVLMLEVILL